MRVRHWLPAVLLLAVGAVPAHATTSTLTLSGTGSGYADVTFTSSVTVDARDPFTSTSSGTYAGWAVKDGSTVVGGLHVDGWFDIAIQHRRDLVETLTATTPSGSTTLAAGTYRFYLLTDGTSSVTISVAGLGSAQSASTSGSITVSAGTTDLGILPVSTTRVPLTIASNTLTVVALRHASLADVVVRDSACVRPGATDECDPLEFATVVGDVGSEVGTDHSYLPGELAAGSYYGVFQVQSIGAFTRDTGFYLTADL